MTDMNTLRDSLVKSAPKRGYNPRASCPGVIPYRMPV